jgi:glycosyltransferase involved in cell wall biosynthesis
LKLLEDVPSNELRQLYRHALATLCPSVGEGFDFSGIEAMRCGSPVIASDIKVHREIFGKAAEYFSPYDSTDAAAAIERVIGTGRKGHRERLVVLGTRPLCSDTCLNESFLCGKSFWQAWVCRRRKKQSLASMTGSERGVARPHRDA